MARKTLSPAIRRKISLAQAGRKNSMYGRKHAPGALAKLRAANKGLKNPMYGKTHTLKIRRQISRMMRQVWERRRALSKRR